jgi:hypothetical protein
MNQIFSQRNAVLLMVALMTIWAVNNTAQLRNIVKRKV